MAFLAGDNALAVDAVVLERVGLVVERNLALLIGLAVLPESHFLWLYLALTRDVLRRGKR